MQQINNKCINKINKLLWNLLLIFCGCVDSDGRRLRGI